MGMVSMGMAGEYLWRGVNTASQGCMEENTRLVKRIQSYQLVTSIKNTATLTSSIIQTTSRCNTVRIMDTEQITGTITFQSRHIDFCKLKLSFLIYKRDVDIFCFVLKVFFIIIVHDFV